MKSITNPITGRKIQVGGKTYAKLFGGSESDESVVVNELVQEFDLEEADQVALNEYLTKFVDKHVTMKSFIELCAVLYPMLDSNLALEETYHALAKGGYKLSFSISLLSK